jgi:DNA-binding response OmpR family regulator
MSSKTRILVVEDDPNILLGLEEVLRAEGFEVVSRTRGDLALAAVEKECPALMILDVMLPGLSGFEVCKRLRASHSRLPVLVLTAKGQEMDKVIGLELGADDYVTKPFGVRELIARIHALLRRVQAAAAESENDGTFQIGMALIDPRRFQLRRGRAVEELTARELKLLQLFHSHSDEVLSRDKLLSEVWGYHYLGTTRTLDQVIVRLRRKLGDNADSPRHLLTVHGVGYKLVM